MKKKMSINNAAMIIKSMPLDQAIQQIKISLTDLPQTSVIEGDLIVCIDTKYDYRNNYEFQHYIYPGRWEFCAYTTYRRKKAKGERVRKRKSGTKPWVCNF